MSRHWTPDGNAAFLRLYPTAGPRAVHSATGRPVGSIKVRAHRLGIATTYQRRSCLKKFDDAEIMDVFERCGFNGRAAAAQLGCGPTVVYRARDRADARNRAEARARAAARRAGGINCINGAIA